MKTMTNSLHPQTEAAELAKRQRIVGFLQQFLARTGHYMTELDPTIHIFSHLQRNEWNILQTIILPTYFQSQKQDSSNGDIQPLASS